ncbi:hypothetical protein CVT24_010033 [Panaeolus cyanescens]|uniref:Uncharacterized protein n=1 Tax=Panaeolus cyanescens TaxID=181874 RepID=A0A409W3Y7_9AGAR|nr:hypothetical protein CVT24_010033 [Panaeolus cyanescens]
MYPFIFACVSQKLRGQLFSQISFRLSSSSSTIYRSPPSSATRQVPTPLLFVSASSLDPQSSEGMTTLSSMLAEKGFTCIQSDLEVHQTAKLDSTKMIAAYESELVSAMRLSTIPFPPVVIARSASCLIAESYISSNSATGMILISPPVSNQSLDGNTLPNSMPEFDYEPYFPIANDNVETLSITSRENEAEILAVVEDWLEELGI